MPMSVRLDRRTESLVRKLAKRDGQSRSEIIRRAIVVLAGDEADAESGSVYDRIAHLVGVADSGGRRLSEKTGQKFRALIAAKARNP